jgi:hypothetical protein
MSFALRNDWHCQFVEDDLKTSLPRSFTFTTADKIVELVRRVGGVKDLASKQAIELAIEKGQGGVFLSLTDDQYQTLRKGR